MVQKIIPDVISNQKLQTLDPDASVKAAASLMGSNRISAILVLKNERLIGIVTERDMTAKVLANGLDPEATKISEVMTPNPDCLSPNDSPSSALQIMSEKGYRHLPVLDGEEAVGMVSIRDLYAYEKVTLKKMSDKGMLSCLRAGTEQATSIICG